jgi:hypothetical protein
MAQSTGGSDLMLALIDNIVLPWSRRGQPFLAAPRLSSQVGELRTWRPLTLVYGHA